MAKIVDLGRTAYSGFASMMNRLQNPLLLAIRLYWGWQFAQDGWGKLTHLDRVTQFFAHIFSKPDDFYGASPYTYWFAALLILILGPGLFAVDWLLQRRFGMRRKA